MRCPDCKSINLDAYIPCYRDFHYDKVDGWTEEIALKQDEVATVICKDCQREWMVDATRIKER